MELQEIFNDKTIKAKAKTALISGMLRNGEISLTELISFAENVKEAVKATCIESIEFATKSSPSIASPECLKFVSKSLADKAPRIKWESAKVVGNIANQFPNELDPAVANLLTNTEHDGTVVRWSAAYALGEIIKSEYPKASELIPAIENIMNREEKNSIKKIYQQALKKVK